VPVLFAINAKEMDRQNRQNCCGTSTHHHRNKELGRSLGKFAQSHSSTPPYYLEAKRSVGLRGIVETSLFEWVTTFVDHQFGYEDPEHVLNAIAKLLLMAAVTGTTSPTSLAKQTGYAFPFVLAVAWNMRVNRRWTEGGYDFSSWLKPSGEYDEHEFLDDVAAAAAELWFFDEAANQTVNTCKIYYDIYPHGT
jgi:hypothetical protein